MSTNLTRLSFAMHEIRAKDENGKRTIAGHAAVFDKPSDPIYGYFTEVIRRGAFANSIKAGADVRCLFNHSADHILGRTKSGTLRIAEDNRGLAIECDMPDTSIGRDVHEAIRRGDIDQMSFGFRTKKDAWTWPDKDDPSAMALRELLEVELIDVSPVTFPAYPDTDVSARQAERRQLLDSARKLRPIDPADVDRRLRFALT